MAEYQDIRKNNNFKIALNLSVNQSSKLTCPSELLATCRLRSSVTTASQSLFISSQSAVKRSSLLFRRVLQPLHLGFLQGTMLYHGHRTQEQTKRTAVR